MSELRSDSLDPANPEHNVARIEEISRSSDAFGRTFDDGTPFFTFVEFSITDLCNRVCVFCPRHDPEVYPNRDEHLSIPLYTKILSELRELEWQGLISFSGYGEPLLHPELDELVAATKTFLPGAVLEMVTNGDKIIADRCRELFDLGLDCMKVSLYDGPEQIEPFETMRTEAGLTEAQFIIRHRFLGPEDDYGLIMTNRAGTVDFEALGMAPLEEAMSQPCYFPFYKMMVDYDGRVLLCSHDWNKDLSGGDLNKMTVEEAWTSKVMQGVRRGLSRCQRTFMPCSACDVDGTLNGGESFAKWVDAFGDSAKNRKT